MPRSVCSSWKDHVRGLPSSPCPDLRLLLFCVQVLTKNSVFFPTTTANGLAMTGAFQNGTSFYVSVTQSLGWNHVRMSTAHPILKIEHLQWDTVFATHRFVLPHAGWVQGLGTASIIRAVRCMVEHTDTFSCLHLRCVCCSTRDTTHCWAPLRIPTTARQPSDPTLPHCECHSCACSPFIIHVPGHNAAASG